MIYEIKNEKLKVAVNTKGAELWSICDSEGTEYLWQGDTTYWSDRALNIFPYVARLTEGKYRLNGQEYNMNIHGFVCTSELEAEQVSEQRVEFTLRADKETRESYPFEFVYTVCYELVDNRLDVTFKVDNLGSEKMYFGIGGHPGFMVPFEEGREFTDYSLTFTEECKPVRIGFSEDCFLNGEDVPYPLQNERSIPLQHNLFDDDAIVLKDMAKEVVLKAQNGRKMVRVTYPDMDYLGIWHMPGTDAPYVCIEPWSSLPSRKGRIEDFAEQPNLVTLEGYGNYQNTWSITIES